MILSTETDGETKAHKTTNTVTLRSQEQEPYRSSLDPHPSAGTESRFGVKWGPVTRRGRWASLSTGAPVSGKVGVQEIPWNPHSVWLRTRGTALGRVCGHQPLGRMPGAQWGPPRSFPAPSLNCPLHILTPKLSFLPKLLVACHSFLWTKASKAHPRIAEEDDASALRTERRKDEGWRGDHERPATEGGKNCIYVVILPKFQSVLLSSLTELQAAMPASQSSNTSLQFVPSIMHNCYYESLPFHRSFSLSHTVSSMNLELSQRNIWGTLTSFQMCDEMSEAPPPSPRQSWGCPGRWSRKDRGDTWAWEHDQSGWFAQDRGFPAVTVGSFPKLTDVSVKRGWQPSRLHGYQDDWSREHCKELKKGLRQGKEERVHMENHKVCQGQNPTLC